jgi:hypothetical protein
VSRPLRPVFSVGGASPLPTAVAVFVSAAAGFLLKRGILVDRSKCGDVRCEGFADKKGCFWIPEEYPESRISKKKQGESDHSINQ